MTTTTLRSSRIASIHYDRGVGIPSSVRSSAASSPDPEDHPPQHPYHHPHHSQPLLPPIRVTSFPSFHHPSEDDWLKNGGRGVGGLASRIGRARFVVLMIMVLPLSLGAWVVSNHRLYDVSFIFAQDGRVRVKRRTLFRRDSLQKQQQQQQHEQEQLDQDLLPSQQQQPILFFTTPVQTVPQQKQQTSLNPVVAKVKTVTGKRGATLRKKNKLTHASPVTKKAQPVATQRRTTTTMSTTKGQPKTPERTTSTNNKVQGFFQTMRLQHQARVHAPRSSTVTPTPRQPPPASSSSSSSGPLTGFFRRIRLRRRSAEEKRQGTATNTAAVASAPVHVVVASSPGRGGMWGLWSAMARRDRSSSTTKEDEEDAPARLPVFEIRLATKYHSSRMKDRLGLTLRQPAIRTQRAEQAQLRRQQDDEVRRMALQLEQERLREAKIVQKQSFRDVVKQEVAKRMEARRDAAAVRLMMQTAAKDAAAQAKQEARTNAKREAQAKVHVKVDATPSRSSSSRSVTKATTQKVIVQNNCAQILDAAKDTESTGFWRRIRLRQRRGIEKTCLMSTQKKSQLPPKPKEISAETTKNWWGPIRFRRRPPSTKEPVAPADQTATTAKSVATSRKVDAPRKENAVVKPEPPMNVLHAVEAETKKRKDALPLKAQAPKKDTPSTNVGPTKSSGGIVIKRRERKSRPVERHSFLGGVTSVFWSKTKRSDSEVVTPLVEKNAPENVLPELLKYFTGAPATDEQPMGRSQARSSTRATVVARHEPVVAPEPKYATFRIRSKPPRPKRPPAIRIRRVRREQES